MHCRNVTGSSLIASICGMLSISTGNLLTCPSVCANKRKGIVGRHGSGINFKAPNVQKYAINRTCFEPGTFFKEPTLQCNQKIHPHIYYPIVLTFIVSNVVIWFKSKSFKAKVQLLQLQSNGTMVAFIINLLVTLRKLFRISQKYQLCHHLLSLKLLQTRMIFCPL